MNVINQVGGEFMKCIYELKFQIFPPPLNRLDYEYSDINSKSK